MKKHHDAVDKPSPEQQFCESGALCKNMVVSLVGLMADQYCSEL